MVALIRTRGLILFMLAMAAAGVLQGIVQSRPGFVAMAAVVLAVAIEEARRRGFIGPAVWVQALRWSCIIGAVGFLLECA